MDSKAGRGDRDDIPGTTRLTSSRNVIELVRLLARIAAERDYREAQQALDASVALKLDEARHD